jgi:uncharacterized delta-60 repeat protein
MADGRIYIGGDFGGSGRNGFDRRNADGTRDPSFAPNQQQDEWQFGGARNIAFQKDGKIILGLDRYNELWLASSNRVIRLNQDGTLDTNFAKVFLDRRYSVSGLVVQNDDKIIFSSSFISGIRINLTNLFRLNADGSPDATFDANQLASQITRLENDDLIAVEEDWTWFPSKASFRAKRMNKDGKSLWTVDSESLAPGVDQRPRLLNDGSLLSVGSFTNRSGNVFTDVLRIGPDGLVDTNFNVRLERVATANVLPVVGTDQTIVYGDFERVGDRRARFMVRLNGDGTLDSNFNIERGVTRTNTFQITPLLSLSGGKTLAQEALFPPPSDGQSTLRLIQLDTTGSLHPDFSPIEVIDASDSRPWIASAIVDGQSNIIVSGGFTSLDKQPRLGLARLLPNGNIDPGFVPEIKNDTFISPPIYEGLPIFDLAGVQDDGKIVLTQTYINFWRLDAGVFRLNLDGSLDSTFKPKGTFLDYFISVSVVSNNKLIVAGAFKFDNKPDCYELARLNPDGSFDESFTPIKCSEQAGPFYDARVRASPGGVLFSRLNGTRFSLITLSFAGDVLARGEIEFGWQPGSFTLVPGSDGSTTIAGMFNAANGEARGSLARLRRYLDFTPPRLTSFAPLGGKPRLLVAYSAPHPCRLDESDDLSNWRKLTNVVGTTVPITVELAPASKKFYRAIVP